MSTTLDETLIRSVKGLENVDQEVIGQIQGAAWNNHYQRGKLLYLEGDPAEHIYLIEQGWVKATRLRKDGREQWMRVLGAGDIFGEIAVLSQTDYPATVVALEPLNAWVFSADLFLTLMENNSFSKGLARRSAWQVLQFARLAEDLSLKSIEQRLVSTLLRYAEFNNGVWEIPRRDWTTFDEMAARLGTVRDVLSRSLRALERENVIKVEKQKIIVVDQAKFFKSLP